MTFAFQHKNTPMPKQFRRDRHRLPVQITREEQRVIDCAMAATPDCETLTLYFSAAVLWFDSLSREVQLDLIPQTMRNSRGRHNRNAGVVAWIGEKFRAMNFPFFPQHAVLACAALEFTKQPVGIRVEWVREVFAGPQGRA